MNGKSLRELIVTSLGSLLLACTFLVSAGYAANVEIVVDSTLDDDYSSSSHTCLNSTPCTLRRAVVQAYASATAGDTVLIKFNIPVTDPGYLGAAIKAWKIKLKGSSSNDLRKLNGRTTINGASQPNGRTTGPKIIVDGQKTHSKGFSLGDTVFNGNNVVRGLAMQNFTTNHVSVNSHNNTVENNWFGLSDDGMHLSTGIDNKRSEGGTGVMIANADNNIVRNNVFAGFFGAAVGITGNNNVFTGNKVGTRSDGTIPLPGTFTQHPCQIGAWVGGSGITFSGQNNQIGGSTTSKKNVFAGIFLDLSPTSTQPPAIKAQSGTGSLVQNNYIGLDAKGKAVGVCEFGLDMTSGPKNFNIAGNKFVETKLSSIVMNSSGLNGNTLRSNVIKRESPWPGSEDAIFYGPQVPDALKNFEPAKVTGFSGLTVSGTSGDGSPCPNCVVELLMDDDDDIKESFKSLGVTTADSSGDWTITLSAPLGPDMGVRTTTTVPDYFIIAGLDPGTTSNLSELYMPPPPKPLVAITALDAVASEPGTNKGKFKITRTRTTTATQVWINVLGTATAGVDYVALPDSVTVPAGVNSVLLTVTPKNDSKPEGNETVIVKIVPKAGYDIGSPAQAKVTIKDDGD